jgi:hypothetical protein
VSGSCTNSKTMLVPAVFKNSEKDLSRKPPRRQSAVIPFASRTAKMRRVPVSGSTTGGVEVVISIDSNLQPPNTVVSIAFTTLIVLVPPARPRRACRHER